MGMSNDQILKPVVVFPQTVLSIPQPFRDLFTHTPSSPSLYPRESGFVVNSNFISCSANVEKVALARSYDKQERFLTDYDWNTDV